MPDLELHYTERNSSYAPADRIHDTYHQEVYLIDNFVNLFRFFSMKKLILILISAFFSFSLFGQKTIELKDLGRSYFFFKEYRKIYKDTSNSLLPVEVYAKQFNLDIIDYDENPDWKTSTFWFKIKIKNSAGYERWLLEIPDFHIQHVGFYSIVQDSLQTAGYKEIFQKRFYDHKNFVYDLDIPKGEERIFLIKMASSTGFSSNVKIYSNPSFISYSTKEYILIGLFYGFLILNALYNLFLYLAMRDKAYIYYFLYILSIGLRVLMDDGLGFQFLWRSHPEMNNILSIASPFFLLFTFVAYATVFLEIRYRKFFNYIIISVAAYIFYYIISKVFLNSNLFDIIYLIPFLLIYIVSIKVYKEGYKPARFFILGYSIFIISLGVFYLRSIGIFHFEYEVLIVLHVYLINIGFAIETFVFSLSLADKIRIFKQEREAAQRKIIDQLSINDELKDKVNRELELKIMERTDELVHQKNLLEEANDKLKFQAEEINRWNQTLDLENYKLKSDVLEVNVNRGLLKSLSLEEFSLAFPNESVCFRFIEELKWGEGYSCKKCGNKKFMMVKLPFCRRCTKCTYKESIKSHTIFQDIKFPVEKAFQIIYLTLLNDGEVSTYDLAKKLGLRQRTCWSFRKRIFDKMGKEKISNKDIHVKGWSIIICDKVDTITSLKIEKTKA